MCGPEQQRFKGTIHFCIARAFLEFCSSISKCSLWASPPAMWTAMCLQAESWGNHAAPCIYFSLSESHPAQYAVKCLRTTEPYVLSSFLAAYSREVSPVLTPSWLEQVSLYRIRNHWEFQKDDVYMWKIKRTKRTGMWKNRAGSS